MHFVLYFSGMIPSPPPRNTRYHQQQQQQQSHNLAEMARLQRMGRAYSHEGVIESSINDIEIFYPGDDGEFLTKVFFCLVN
jgi:hypothetical protein